MEGEFQLESPNFQMAATQVKGRGSCNYFLSIPLCRRPDIASIAWEELHKQANLNGRSARLVNVAEDAYHSRNLFFIYYQRVHAVSANVIVYE
jgi:hypothetical protein